MNTIPPASALSRHAALAGGGAVQVEHVAPEIGRLASGTILNGTVVSRDARGSLHVATEHGAMIIRTSLPLREGALLKIEVQITGHQTRAVILAVEPPPGHAKAGPEAASTARRRPGAGTPTPTAQSPQAAASVVRATSEPLRPGAIVVARLIDPPPPVAIGRGPMPGGAMATGTPVETLTLRIVEVIPAPTSPRAAAPPLPGASPPTPTAAPEPGPAPRADAPAIPDRPPARPTAPSARDTTPPPAPAAARSPVPPTPPTPGAESGAPRPAGHGGTGRATVEAAQLQTPGETARSQTARETTRSQTVGDTARIQTAGGPPAAGARVLTATATTAATGGHTILATPVGRLLIAANGSLPPRAIIRFEIVTATPNAGAPPNAPLPAPATVIDLARDWPGLRDMVETLTQLNPAVATQISEATIPHAGSRLAQTVLFFVTALRLGDITSWLGGRAETALKSAGRSDILTRVTDEFQQLARAAADGGDGEWRTYLVPFHDGDRLQQMRFFHRRYGGDDPADADGRGDRFLIDLQLSRLGQMQLDGLLQTGRFSLVLRSAAPIAQDAKLDMRALFRDGCACVGLKGEINFAGASGFVPLPLAAVAKTAGALTV